MLASLLQAIYTQLILVISSIFSIQLNLDKEDEQHGGVEEQPLQLEGGDPPRHGHQQAGQEVHRPHVGPVHEGGGLPEVEQGERGRHQGADESKLHRWSHLWSPGLGP